MKENQEGTNYKWNENIQPHMSENQRNDCNHAKPRKNNAVVHNPVKYQNGFIPKEVEEEPGDEHNQENDHGDGMPQ